MAHKDLMNIKYPLLIDGGLSNVLEEQGHDLNHKLWTAKLLETDPESIIQAHYAYLKSGAKCITSSSYQASVRGFMAIGHDPNTAEILIKKTIHLAEIAIERARESGVVDHNPLIAASIGPYGAYLADGSEYHGNYGVSDTGFVFVNLDLGLKDGSGLNVMKILRDMQLDHVKVVVPFYSLKIPYKYSRDRWHLLSSQGFFPALPRYRVPDCVAR